MASVKTKVVVIFYSLYTHTWQLAQAIAEGAKEVDGVEVEMYQVPELLPDDVIGKMG
jgi:NAD(P)H dehydrogenase (quinone)